MCVRKLCVSSAYRSKVLPHVWIQGLIVFELFLQRVLLAKMYGGEGVANSWARVMILRRCLEGSYSEFTFGIFWGFFSKRAQADFSQTRVCCAELRHSEGQGPGCNIRSWLSANAHNGIRALGSLFSPFSFFQKMPLTRHHGWDSVWMVLQKRRRTAVQYQA